MKHVCNIRDQVDIVSVHVQVVIHKDQVKDI